GCSTRSSRTSRRSSPGLDSSPDLIRAILRAECEIPQTAKVCRSGAPSFDVLMRREPMETCFVSSTRREPSPTFPSSPRPYGAALDLSMEPTGDAVTVHVKTAKLTYPVLSAFFEEVRAI